LKENSKKLLQIAARSIRADRSQTSKSFLLLFSKKQTFLLPCQPHLM
jgi:hypothetical protein